MITIPHPMIGPGPTPTQIVLSPTALEEFPTSVQASYSEPFYLPCASLSPAQIRISRAAVREKIEKSISKQNALWDSPSQKWVFKHDAGKSLFPLKNPIPIVRSPFGFIPADGHHDIQASLDLGASTVPVRIVADLSHLPLETFWSEAEAEGWAYLYTFGGEKSSPLHRFEDLIDDPNRRFASITARKYHLDGSSSGAEYPLWIKLERDIPFIEFKIADALWEKGVVYDDSQPLTFEFLEKAREILIEAKIEGLKLVPSRKHASEIPLF